MTRPKLVPPLLLVLLAFGYYGLYFRSGFNLMDDGSVVLLAKRIMEGERPIVDLMLGYNVLWFYPISGLFAIFGPNFIVARIWFFFLATLSGLLAYLLLQRLSGKRWFSFGAALLLILLPGTTNKTYIPLIVVANVFLLVHAIWTNGTWRNYLLICGAGGAVLAWSSLTRVELGIFFAVIWIGLFLLNLLRPQLDLGSRFRCFLSGFVALVISVVLVHLPVCYDAYKRGFGGQLLGQNAGYIDYLAAPFRDYFERLTARPAPSEIGAATTALEKTATQEQPRAESKVMQRRPFSDLWEKKSFRRRGMVVAIYAPLLSVVLLLAWAVFFLSRGWWKQDSVSFDRFAVLLITTGGALTAFPQYFLFRPDTAHISEFMPGMMLAAAAGGWILWAWFRASSGIFSRAAVIVTLLFLTVHIAIYAAWGLQQGSAGTVAARTGRTELFEGENGVHVYLRPEEHAGFEAIHRIITENSGPDEFVIGYPYSPGINFMTNRSTYEGRLYVDDVHHPEGFRAQAIEKIEHHKPAIIVINDWAINRTENSRFSVWAKEVHEYITRNYFHAGHYIRHDIYTKEKPKGIRD